MDRVAGAHVDPAEFTGFLLRRAYLVSRAHAQACVGDDATVRDVPALTLVRADPTMSQRRLGERLGVNRTTTSQLVDALESRGWLRRSTDPADRRSYVLRLTPSGQLALTQLHGLLDESERHLTERLTSSERDQLRAVLSDLLSDDPTVALDGLGTRCGYLIARAHQALFRKASERLSPLGLTPRDFGVLAVLSSVQPCSQQRLASTLGVSAPAVLAFVDDLERAGLVSRQRNAADRRAYVLTLTDAGRELLDQARRGAVELQLAVTRTLGPDGDEELRRLLLKVIEAGHYPVARAVDTA